MANKTLARKVFSVQRGTGVVFRVSGIPMVGTLYFGLVDRGTNVVEVRPTSVCALSCIFCSVNAGPKSRIRRNEFVVELDDLLDAAREVAHFKGRGVEFHIDGMGDPGNYDRLVDLVAGLREIPETRTISMQTRLFMMSEDKVRQLAEAGLDRINLSVDALDVGLAADLADTEWYDVRRVIELAEYTVRNTSIDVIVSPVWVPGINDGEIARIAAWAHAALGKKWPPVLVQKYVAHRRGRKPVREMGWRTFWEALRRLERETGLRLVFEGNAFGIERRAPLPKPYAVGEKVRLRVVTRGIFAGEYLAVPLRLRGSTIHDRSVTIVSHAELPEDAVVTARVVENKDNIYLASPSAGPPLSVRGVPGRNRR